MQRQEKFLGINVRAVLIVVAGNVCSWNATNLVAQGPPPALIQKSGLQLEVELYAQLPITGQSPNTRINVLREEPAGADRLFVDDLNGFLYTLDKQSRKSTTYLDFTSRFPELKTATGMADGLVSFAFHPEFATNGKFYTIHAENMIAPPARQPSLPPLGIATQQSVLVEWTADDPSAPVFQGTQRELMRLGMPGRFHPLGDAGFNPNAAAGDDDYGMLYLSIGEGQSYELEQSENLQRLDSFLGSILRIDPDPSGSPIAGTLGDYSVPETNPWASDGDASSLAELFAYGFRNPHRFSWDTETHTMFVTDIGERTVEEVNIVEAGENYGWPIREGAYLVGGDPLPPDDAEANLHYPVAVYGRGDGRAISNGFVYRGSSVPELRGQYVFGDITNGKIFYSAVDEMLSAHDTSTTDVATVYELQLALGGELLDLMDIVSKTSGLNISRTDLRLGEDARGELYLMSKQSGQIFSFVPTGSPLDCNGDGVLDRTDLQCVCGLSEEDRAAAIGQLEILPSDLDGDGTVGFGDFLILSAGFGAAGSFDQGDFDCSSTVDFADFLVLASAFGTTSVAAVPEPTWSWWWLSAAMLGFRGSGFGVCRLSAQRK